MTRFQQVPPNHVFKVGQTIRLGGRVGRIKNSVMLNTDWWTVEWQMEGNGNLINSLGLFIFPSLEVEVKPVTISREAYEELERWIDKHTDRQSRFYSDGFPINDSSLLEKLRSMLPDETGGE